MKSKIKQIHLENFMAFSNALIEFDERNIINLKGYSDSGKSSILIAIAVCLNNFKPSKQVNWIKDTCKFFKISISFDDNVKIVRYKYNNGQSLYEMYKDGALVYTSKINNTLTAINDVPEVISNYLELSELKSGILNFRTNQDKQFLAQTTGSENFQDLNNLFGIDEILSAIKYCKEDISVIVAEMNKNESEISFLRDKVAESRDLSQETLIRVLEEDKLLNEGELKVSELGVVSECISNIKSSKELPKINEITSSIKDLFELSSLVEVLSKEEEIKLDEVSDKKLKSLLDVSNTLKGLSEEGIEVKQEEIKTDKIVCLLEIKTLLGTQESVLPSLELQETQLYKDLNNLNTDLLEILNISKVIKSEEEENNKLKDMLEQIKQKLKSKGITLHECSNCGNFTCEGVIHEN